MKVILMTKNTMESNMGYVSVFKETDGNGSTEVFYCAELGEIKIVHESFSLESKDCLTIKVDKFCEIVNSLRGTVITNYDKEIQERIAVHDSYSGMLRGIKDDVNSFANSVKDREKNCESLTEAFEGELKDRILLLDEKSQEQVDSSLFVQTKDVNVMMLSILFAQVFVNNDY